MFWRAAVLVFLVDQVVKWWATHSLMLDQSVPVLPPYFYLTLTHNTGIAFGLLEGRGWLTIPLTLCVAGGLVWYQYRHKPPRGVQLLTGLLLGGALGNFRRSPATGLCGGHVRLRGLARVQCGGYGDYLLAAGADGVAVCGGACA
jgi:hypothetical protein